MSSLPPAECCDQTLKTQAASFLWQTKAAFPQGGNVCNGNHTYISEVQKSGTMEHAFNLNLVQAPP